jgi:hypothetical protein
MNPVAIEGHLTLVLIQWIIIIAAAGIFGRLGKKSVSRWPSVKLRRELFWGRRFLVRFAFGWAIILMRRRLAIFPQKIFPPETQTSMQLLGKLGLIFLLFQVGMEFDYSHLRAKSKTVTSVSIFGMVMPFL